MGRYIDALFDFDDVNILLKYLYLSEDNTVEFTNDINTVFLLRMDDDLRLHRKIISGLEGTIDLEFECHDMTHTHLMAIVDQLKETPAKEFPDRFKNRFEEIKEITLANIAMNMSNQSRMGRKWERTD